ncbi:MAG: N-acetyltransferase family protein [Acetobacteraceae bacterium]
MIAIRRMATEDLTAARALLHQLGYRLDAEEVRRRHGMIAECDDHVLLVAEQDGSIIALCHVYARPALDKPPEAVVQALIVDEACRGNGVGRKMMDAAETWARDHDFTSLALASHVARAEAHAFYKGLGYCQVATSHMFRKTW